MPLPDFLIIGAPKAGSTALHAALLDHPQLYLGDPKEPKHFMTAGRPRRRHHRGPGDAHSAREWIWRRSDYEALFADSPPGALRGESSPFYLWDRDAHQRMAETVPNAKLIGVVRDPVDRAYSNWTHLRADGLEPERDFRAACNLEQRRAAAGWAPFWRYLELGRYGEQLAHLRRFYPAEQIYLLRYAELVDEPERALHSICDFLGVERVINTVPGSNVGRWAAETPVNEALRRVIRAGAAVGSLGHPRRWRAVEARLKPLLQRGDHARPRLTPDVRSELIDRFAEDITLLESLVGRSFHSWRDATDRGSFAVRTSLAPASGREDSQ